MRIYLAGSIGVETDVTLLRETRLPGTQGRHLFAMLAAEHQRSVTRDELAEEVWDGQPPRAWDNAIRLLVHKLRAALLQAFGPEGELIATGGRCYRFVLPPAGWLDLDAAGIAVNHAESALAIGDIEAAHADANVACAIARRPLLPGVEGHWLREQRGELRNQRTRALECLSEVWLRRGDLKQAAHYAELATRSDPYAGRALRQLMRAHLADGERARAIRAYEDHRDFLRRTIGIPPTEKTEAVYRRLVAAG